MVSYIQVEIITEINKRHAQSLINDFCKKNDIVSVRPYIKSTDTDILYCCYIIYKVDR